MGIEPSFCYWMAGVVGGDDDVRLAVHEATRPVGLDFIGDAGHGRGCLQREGLGAWGGLAKFVDTNVVVGVLRAVDGKDVGDGLRSVGWKVVHDYLATSSQLHSIGWEEVSGLPDWSRIYTAMSFNMLGREV